ncbi:unnamed protein product [Ranitomeya imitator]|uniref:Uncharacterized protein n=1 Tax=Ranitomeya imitator TaxID=111125 RepID=A0ABN9MB92_9NEOB|nr:unnamed protein product [Ranitomeya imitator]
MSSPAAAAGGHVIKTEQAAIAPIRGKYINISCQVANKTCPRNHIWNNHLCRCIQQHDLSSYHEGSDSSEAFHDVCGPNKELDEETCQCVCKGGLLPSSCGPHKKLDRTSCQCVCKNKLLLSSCGTNKEYDEESCSRPPCPPRLKRCDPGFYYSEEVCRCVPTFWKIPHMN